MQAPQHGAGTVKDSYVFFKKRRQSCLFLQIQSEKKSVGTVPRPSAVRTLLGWSTCGHSNDSIPAIRSAPTQVRLTGRSAPLEARIAQLTGSSSLIATSRPWRLPRSRSSNPDELPALHVRCVDALCAVCATRTPIPHPRHARREAVLRPLAKRSSTRHAIVHGRRRRGVCSHCRPRFRRTQGPTDGGAYGPDPGMAATDQGAPADELRLWSCAGQ